MPKIQYKHKKGALHIGGGRFFYANEPVEVSAKERDELLSRYEDLEEVKPQKESNSSNGE
jgi:hypothetical protein